MIKKIGYIILILSLLPINGLLCQDEVGEEEIKASILYYLCQYIEWPKDELENEFSFGLLGDMPEFARELSLIADAERSIKERPINIEMLSLDNLNDQIQVLIVSSDYYDQISEIFSFCRRSSVLLVTDELDDRLHSMINFYYNQNKEAVNFEVNKQNLILSRFNYEEDILIYGGSLIDVKELHEATQLMLERESQKADLLEANIAERDIELVEKNLLIERLNKDIEEGESFLKELADSIIYLSVELRDQQDEMAETQIQLEKLTEQYQTAEHLLAEQQIMLSEHEKSIDYQENKIKQQEGQIKAKEAQRTRLDDEIKANKEIIENQSLVLSSQKSIIQRKNNALLFFSVLGGLITIIGFLLLRAYKTKQKYSALLENSNEQLKLSNAELSDKSEIIYNQNVELKETLRNLQDAQSKLLQAEKMASLGILTAGVAHEINNPLNYIMGAYTGLSQYFRKNKSVDPATTDFLISSMKTGLDRATEIVEGLNQFSRDSEKYDEECHVHSIIDNCLTMLNNQFKNRIQVTCKYTAENDLIKGNSGKLHQVFLNILTNSAQAIKESGAVAIFTEVEGDSLKVSVEDDGEGIAESDLPKITDPFYTTKDPGEGTGLGLSITYNILQDHGGDIKFTSKKGEGTTVTINLPYKN